MSAYDLVSVCKRKKDCDQILSVSIKRFTIHTGEGRKHRNRKLLCAEQFIQAFRIAACRCKNLLAGFECPFLTRAVVGYVRKRNIKFTEITLKFPDFFTGCSALVRCFDRILRIFQMVNLNSVLFAVMNRFMKRNNLQMLFFSSIVIDETIMYSP